MAPEIAVTLGSPLAGVTLRSDFLPSEYSVEAKSSRLLQELNHYKLENDQLIS